MIEVPVIGGGVVLLIMGAIIIRLRMVIITQRIYCVVGVV